MEEIMTSLTVRTATLSDQHDLIAVITLAFSSDPAARWAYPDPQQYLGNFPDFVTAFGGKAFEHDTSYCVEDSLGAALWLPPGVEPEEDALLDLIRRTVPERNQEAMFSIFEQMGSYHPSEPHWYLPLIGVDPAQQGKGYGSALMEHALAACDREHLPAYLESSNPRNIPLYRRHGFELLGTIQVGSSPPIFPMLRNPRPL
jgi:ribosomal protein S18 acetylase RimI-like enzyme